MHKAYWKTVNFLLQRREESLAENFCHFFSRKQSATVIRVLICGEISDSFGGIKSRDGSISPSDLDEMSSITARVEATRTPGGEGTGVADSHIGKELISETLQGGWEGEGG